MSHHRRAPRPLSATLARAQEQWQPNSALGRAQSAWDQLGRAWATALGPHAGYIVARATPVSLRAGVLTISCSEAAVAQTLELESAAVIARLNAQLSDDPVARLRCVTGA